MSRAIAVGLGVVLGFGLFGVGVGRAAVGSEISFGVLEVSSADINTDQDPVVSETVAVPAGTYQFWVRADSNGNTVGCPPALSLQRHVGAVWFEVANLSDVTGNGPGSFITGVSSEYGARDWHEALYLGAGDFRAVTGLRKNSSGCGVGEPAWKVEPFLIRNDAPDTVDVGNFPSSFNVGNFPSSVNVGNFPGSQNVVCTSGCTSANAGGGSAGACRNLADTLWVPCPVVIDSSGNTVGLDTSANTITFSDLSALRLEWILNAVLFLGGAGIAFWFVRFLAPLIPSGRDV